MLRAAGITVIEDAGARSRRHGEMVAVRGLIWHHTGSSSATAWRTVRDGRSDLKGPLAQMTLERDGSVRVLSTGQAWHAGTGSWPSIGRNNGNAYCLGIEAVYNGSDVTAAQLRVYPLMSAAIVKAYKIPVGNMIGHREWAPGRKPDPGKIDMVKARAQVAALVAGSAVPPPPPATNARPLLSEGMVSALIWDLQGFTNRVFSSYSNINRGPGPTSRYGPQTVTVIKEFQHRVHIDTDGKVGPQTWAHLERFGFGR